VARARALDLTSSASSTTTIPCRRRPSARSAGARDTRGQRQPIPTPPAGAGAGDPAGQEGPDPAELADLRCFVLRTRRCAGTSAILGLLTDETARRLAGFAKPCRAGDWSATGAERDAARLRRGRGVGMGKFGPALARVLPAARRA